MTARESEIIGLIRKEVKPALGCTEPIAVALAVAKAMAETDAVTVIGGGETAFHLKDVLETRSVVDLKK
jgi:hypothetical protein